MKIKNIEPLYKSYKKLKDINKEIQSLLMWTGAKWRFKSYIPETNEKRLNMVNEIMGDVEEKDLDEVRYEEPYDDDHRLVAIIDDKSIVFIIVLRTEGMKKIVWVIKNDEDKYQINHKQDGGIASILSYKEVKEKCPKITERIEKEIKELIQKRKEKLHRLYRVLSISQGEGNI